MVEGPGVCPFCGTPRNTSGEATCSGCGRQLPAATASVAGAGVPPLAATASGAGAAAPPSATTASVAAAAPTRRPVLSSWRELRSILRVAGYTLIGWAAMSVAVGLTFGKAIENGVGTDLFPGYSLSGADVTLFAAHIAMFSSLVAGLGFNAYGSGGIVTLSAVPLGSIAVLALLARIAARRALRRNPPSGIADLFVRITLAAGIAALAIYTLSAIAIVVYAQSILPPVQPLTGSSVAEGATAASPTPEGLFFVLFPALWLATVAGVFSLAPARTLVGRALFARVDPTAAAALRLAGSVALAIRAYVRAVLVISPLVVLGWVAFVVLNTSDTDTMGVGFSLPAVLAMGPNAVLALALGVTGTVIHYGTREAVLWHADAWIIAAGVISLILPALVAGISLGRRRPDASPGEVGLAGLSIGAAGLMLANIASASAKAVAVAGAGTGTQALVNPGGGIAKLTFDLGEAALVGGSVILAVVVLGYVLGMMTSGAPAAARSAAPATTR